MNLLAELKRRNVFRVAAAYVVSSWLIVQVVETIFPAFGFGDAAIRVSARTEVRARPVGLDDFKPPPSGHPRNTRDPDRRQACATVPDSEQKMQALEQSLLEGKRKPLDEVVEIVRR